MSADEPIGSLGWTRRTAGRLALAELYRFLGQGIALQIGNIPPRLATRLGLRRERLGAAILDGIAIPDSAVAREAEQLCEEMQSPALANHSRRCYLWGAALAEQDRLEFDPELLYVASLLHDVGLPIAVAREHDHCFTLDSIGVAEPVVSRAGWNEERTARVCEAITFHLNASVSSGDGPEAHLLNGAAALDVAGIRYWEVDRSLVDAVVARHPRAGFKREFVPLLGAHCKQAPRSRAAAFYRYGAFGRTIRRAPFAE